MYYGNDEVAHCIKWKYTMATDGCLDVILYIIIKIFTFINLAYTTEHSDTVVQIYLFIEGFTLKRITVRQRMDGVH